MNRITLFATLVVATSIGSQARSAEDGVTGLELCFQAARQSDLICSNPDNTPEQRLDCFQKARAAQLECLDHVPLGVTGSMTPAEPPEARPAPKTASRELEVESPPPPPPEKTVEPPRVATAPALEASPVVVAPVEQIPLPMARPSVAAPPTISVPPSVSGKPVEAVTPPSSSGWIVSETTSPIDYSPMVIATMRSASEGDGAPMTLSIMCRRQRTEIVLRGDAAWHAVKNNKVQVAFQINDKSTSSSWNLSADGKAATNLDNAVELLQSLPEGAPLKARLFDGADHNATFQLAGLDLVRHKIAAACKLPPAPDSKLLVGKR